MPEFGKVFGGIAVFCAERRTEGINLTHSSCSHFALKLTGYRKPCFSSEEIICTIFIFRLVFGIVSYCSDLKHLARTLAVTSCYKGGIYIYVVIFLKILMQCGSKHRTYSPYSIESIAPAPEMGHRPHKFESMTFFLQRVIRGAVAEDFNIRRKCIDFLCIVASLNDISRNFQGHTHTGFLVLALAFFDYYLDIFKGSAVIEFNESNAL